MLVGALELTSTFYSRRHCALGMKLLALVLLAWCGIAPLSPIRRMNKLARERVASRSMQAVWCLRRSPSGRVREVTPRSDAAARERLRCSRCRHHCQSHARKMRFREGTFGRLEHLSRPISSPVCLVTSQGPPSGERCCTEVDVDLGRSHSGSVQPATAPAPCRLVVITTLVDAEGGIGSRSSPTKPRLMFLSSRRRSTDKSCFPPSSQVKTG